MLTERQRHAAELLCLGLTALALLIRFPLKLAFESPFLMDFELFRGIAARLLAHDGARLYASVDSGQALFKYAPVWALCWLPFGALSSHVGAVLWTTLNVLWLTVTLWCASRLCQRHGLRVHPLTPAIVVLLLNRMLTEEFMNGQTDLLWALLIVVAIDGVSANRRWMPAITFALAMSLKLPAAIFLPYLLIRRRWPVLWRTVAGLLVINGLGAWLILPHDPLRLFADWWHVLRVSGPDRAFEIGAQSFLALASRFLSADGYHLNLLRLSRQAVVTIALLTECGLFGWLTLRRRPEPLRWLLDTACLTAFMALFSPTCWLETYSVLAAPLVVALALLATFPRIILRTVPLNALCAAIVGLSVFTHRKFWHWIGIPRIGNESYTFLVAVIPAWLGLAVVAFLWRSHASCSRASSPAGTTSAR